MKNIVAACFSIVFLWLSACQTSKPTASRGISDTSASSPKKTVPVIGDIEIDTIPEWAAKQGPYNPERTKRNDLLHTKLEVSFDWQKQYLNGTATLTFKPYFYPQNNLQLDAKGFDIHSIKLIEEKTKKSAPLQYNYNNRIIDIKLDKTYTRNDSYIVQIEYTAKPNELPAGGSEAITSDKGLYFINPDGSDPDKPRQIWTQGETEANSAWFPTIDSPNERTTQEMYITVDTSFTTLSNGSFVYSRTNKDGTKTDYWKQDKSHAPYLFMMAIGEYAIVKDKWNNMEVNYYVEPAYEKYARNIFGNTPEMLEFFSDKLKYKYPWDKYSQVVVRDFVSGAMENTTAVTFMEAVQVDDRQLMDEHWDGIIAHELFHHWFGDLVTTESWSNLPLNESFANYAEYLWAEHKYGIEEADYLAQGEAEQYFEEAQNKQEPLIRYHYLDKDDMFDSHSYAKGGRILHMLRKYVGDEAFFEALNLYLKKNEYSDVEIHNLRLAFEEITGEDLNWFFNQWFLSAGHPTLALNHTYADGKVLLGVKQLQDSLYTPVYKLPVKVDVWVNGQKTRHDVVIDQASQTIELSAAAKPDLVLFDAEAQLLGIVNHPKSQQELAFQYYNSNKYLPRFEALTQLTNVLAEKDSAQVNAAQVQNELVQKVAIDALNDKSWRIRQLAIQNFANYSGPRVDSLESKLRNMAKQDPRSYVRAEAIDVLSTFQNGNYKELYLQGMEDKSYAVVASSLYAYLNSGAEDAQEKVEKFKNYTNTDIIFTIADYYSESGLKGGYEWFENKIRTTDNQTLYQLIQFFGRYLVKLQPEDQKKGIAILEDLARNGDIYYVRFSAYQTLGLFTDVEGINDLRKDIRDKEKDEKLKELYDLLP